MTIIDLRSDTVTKPTPAMRRAMYDAEVGDDVLGDDPTVQRLEKLAAARLGKEAALFVPSGTMGNLVSLLVHCGRGDEVILGDQAHTYVYEAGGSSAVGGIHPRPLPNRPDGTIDLALLEASIRPDDIHAPRTKLITLENTHNRCGGAVLPVAYMDAVSELVSRRGLALHLDGARVFNAAVALGVDVQALVRGCDSVSFCLSKGLGAPVGSVVVGSAAFIHEARRGRKLVGGGMRQAGVIAAAGIVALTEMVDRLADDHTNARRLAEGIAGLPGIVLDPATVQTNIVIFALERPGLSPQQLAAQLAERDVWLFAIGGQRLRAVTNYHVTAQDVERAIGAFAAILRA
ncbi:MAG TPA: low-specificity L-threonine aldolase [Anaerolineae bacterium]|nr:low-specificity L-threonine aldolase [Anaerolineae bacterium]